MTFQGHLKRRKMLLPMLTNSLDILENENNNSNRMGYRSISKWMRRTKNKA